MTDRAWRGWLVACLAAAAYAIPIAPAGAADQEVRVGNDKRLSPTAVTLAPGERVTWRWVGPDTNHIMESDPNQAEFWDSDPGLDDVDHPLNRTFAHQFSRQGTFTYHCRIHEEMQGTVRVAAAPVASFTASPSSAGIGETVAFDASASNAPGSSIAGYRWDLDGDGSFETNTGAVASAARAYPAAGVVTIRLRVTDAGGATADTTRSVTVVAAPPPPPAPAPPAATPPAGAGLAPQALVASLRMAPRDATAPTGRLSPGGTQRVLRTRSIVVTGTWNENASVAAAATITVPGARPMKLVGPRRAVRAGAKSTFTLKLSGRTLAALRSALARGALVSARVTLSATDAAGNGGVATLKVRLAR